MYSEPEADFIPLRPLPDQGTIGVVAPSSPVEQNQLERGVAYLKKLGYQVITGESCYARENYLAGSDALRANDLMHMIDNDNVDAVFCAGGGFGCLRILNMLDYELIADKRKMIVGYSDITALHWAVYAQTGLPGISAGMVASDFGREHVDPFFEKWFWPLIRKGNMQIAHPSTDYAPHTAIGTAMAGTVSVLTRLLGSEFFPRVADPVYIFEDVDEPMHKLEGNLQQCVLTGALDQVEAIFLGTFTPASRESFEDIPSPDAMFDRIFRAVRAPIIKDLDYGHINSKMAVPVGMPVELEISRNGTMLSIATNPFKS